MAAAFESPEGAPRLDRFLAACLPEWSRTRLQEWIRAGRVQVGGVAVLRPGAALAAGARVEVDTAPGVRERAAGAAAPAPEAIPLDILYEDEDLAAINKPAGLLVHAGAGQRSGTLVNALLHRYGALAAAGPAAAQRPGIVHRLDRSTSGVMVVARTELAQIGLARQFQQRTVVKIYHALAHGALPGQGEITLPISRDRLRRRRMTTRRAAGPGVRAAHSTFRRLELFDPPAAMPAALRAACRFSWLEIQIHTGRTHQVRVHLAALGHPVVGDRLYGAAAVLAGPGGLTGWRPPRVMLHASRLELAHPRTGLPLRFAAPLAPDLAALLDRMRAV